MQDCEIVLRLNAMGDILLTVPTLRALSAQNIAVHAVVHGRWAQIGDFLPAQIHYYQGTGSLMRLAGKLKKLRARAVFDLQGKIATIALRSLLNAPITRAYQKRELNEQLLALRGKYPLRFSDQRPVWQKYAEVCGVNLAQPDPSLNLSSAYLKTCRKIINELNLTEKKYILLHPDASKPGKIMPENLLKALCNSLPLPTAIVGVSSQPLPVATSTLDLRNRISLYHLPGIMHLAAAVISTDSGPMHLARAVGTPLLAMFFQTCPSLGFSPIPAANVMVLSEPRACKPCSLHGQNADCPEGHFLCRQLDVAATIDKTQDFLANWL